MPAVEKIKEIHEKGYTLVEKILDAGQVSALTQLLEKCIQEDIDRFGDQHPERWMVQNLMMRGTPFVRLMELPQMHEYLSELLTQTCILYAYTSSSMPPGGTNYSHRIHVDCPRFIPGYITNMGVMFALTDFTAENGATYFMPGSQLKAEAPTEAEFKQHARRVFPRAGDAVIFNTRTFHMGGANSTSQPRHSFAMNVCRSYMRQRFDYPRMVPKEVVDQLGEVGKRFLGFNVRMPTSLEEFYLPAEKRLYKPNQG